MTLYRAVQFVERVLKKIQKPRKKIITLNSHIATYSRNVSPLFTQILATF
jgi:hypothetical protein